MQSGPASADDFVRAPGNQAHFTDQLSTAQDHRRAAAHIEVHLTSQYVEYARGVVAFGEDAGAPGRRYDRAHQQQLAQSQHLDVAEEGQSLVNHADDALDIASPAQRAELGPQDVVIGGRHLAAEQMLDHFVALVHGLLDERIAGEGADDIKPWHRRLEFRRQLRQRIRLRRDEAHSRGLDELTRRNGAQACNHAIAGNRPLPLLGRYHHAIRRGRSIGTSDNVAWRLFASAFMKHLTRPALIALVIFAAFASLARGKPLLRFSTTTELFLDRAIAFSIAASPAPITTIVSARSASADSSVYCTQGRSPPGTLTRRG